MIFEPCYAPPAKTWPMPEATHDPSTDAPPRKEVRRILERRAKVAQERLAFIHATLRWEQSQFLTLLPLLLHVNHPSLPGFQGSEVPAGIAGYEPSRQALLSARQYARGLGKHRRAQRFPPLLGLYLIGSSGTLGQDRQSDFDIWVCHHPLLSPEQLAALEQKTQALEAIATELGLEVHFFILHAEGFRQGQHNALSDESSGNTQHHLLLEEFYRTGLLLAGRPPLWWIVPPHRQHEYRRYCDNLLEKRFVQENEWLDFGGLEDISAGEFFSAAHWQLFKGIQVPYKSLLKLLLFEAFASEFPAVRWVAEEAQAHYHGEQQISAIDVDPYLLMMQRIDRHLRQKGEAQRLLLARRAFYIKTGVRLSRAQDDWKAQTLRRLSREWGWDEGEIINLDQHDDWNLSRVIEERNKLVAELSQSYRLLTTFARQQDVLEQIDRRELSLLGRKLYSSLERRPGKIDRVNPGISDNIRQDEIWLRRHPETHAWQCFLSPPDEGGSTVKSTVSIIELLTWLSANEVIDNQTRIDVPAADTPISPQEHLHILKVLRQHFPVSRRKSAPLGEFARQARGMHALAVINALQPVQQHAHGQIVVSQRGDPLSFGTQHLNLVEQVDHVHDNNLGELHVTHHTGANGLLDMLCRHLELFIHQTQPGTLACHCETPGHGANIAKRLSRLADRVLEHFQRHGDNSRYVLQIVDALHVIDRQRGQFNHRPLGNRNDLMDYLEQVDETFHNIEIDAASLDTSPLPLVLRLNRPGCTQVCYQAGPRGIQSFILDPSGAVIEQHLQHAGESHFLTQQQRFFIALGEWQNAVGKSSKETEPEYIRLERCRDEWRTHRPRPPIDGANRYTELLLSTGPRGPWQDGFSLLSGDREFNSVELGARIYSEVVSYLQGLRKGDEPYPFYLTGVSTGEFAIDSPLSVADMLRFKVRIEQRLNRAGNTDPH